MGSVGEFARRTELLVLSWLILQLTDSYLQLGLILVFNNLPRPVFSTFTGLIADRFDRRMVLIVAQTVNTCTAGAVLRADGDRYRRRTAVACLRRYFYPRRRPSG